MVGRYALSLALLAAASPAASQVTPREIAEIADISGLAASPDGRWLAYRVERPSTADNRIDAEWFIVAADGRTSPRSLGQLGTALSNDAGSILPGEIGWTPDSRSIVVRALVDERVGLWRSAIDGSGFSPAIVADGDVENFALLPDGTLVVRQLPSRAETMRAEEREREAGILVDGRTDLAAPLFRGGIVNGRHATQRFTGDWFNRAPLLGERPPILRTWKLDTGEERPLSKGEISALADRPTLELPAAPAAALEAAGACIAGPACADATLRLSSWIGALGGRIVMALRDGAYRQTLYIWSPETGNVRKLASGEGLLAGNRLESTACAPVPDAVFCVEAAPSIAPRLVRIGFNGRKTIIASPNGYPGDDGLLAETVAWQVSGSRASGILIRPKIPGRLPLFVTYYRCAGYPRGGLGDEWPLRALAASGIAALCINALPGGAKAEDRYGLAMAAVRAAIDELDRRGIADRNRVGMGGLSFGSEVTMWIATHSDMLRAASIASLQMGPAYYWFNARPGREMFTANLEQYFGVGSPDDDPDGWRRMSAASNLDKLEAPLLLQLPEHEARQTIELISKVATAEIGETHIFPLAPHIKVEPRQRLAAYNRNLDWFRYWLKDESDPDPKKAAQYQRWAAIRAARDALSSERSQRSISAISSNRK
ncbi:Atxe2 family lasso peptide isopeptidase [Sphingopyxis macrogoltabida]|uniref:Peptidase S9 prolyl oligopeptidase catalytic domain-containing protein n=1 Tax=Sphingopyxis macrogoltabida TaxID=33050 RepID=A0AAC8Z2G9_SPHMC|nr:Atxe2 family lasso peptide isopeptidase [Sphingopyxis macrogoltabida]ALJ14060.1 hypothetical protein LH19_14395 [Sphingopyxis macrogoltabida]AMU90337.1 hypothetical protein ATM17_15015 [Sphingopyxis macrogoltabida]